jgi:hypothetical protein
MAQLKDLWAAWDKTKLPMRISGGCEDYKYADIYFLTKADLFHGVDEQGRHVIFAHEEDKELYKEPKKTKKLWEFLYRVPSGRPMSDWFENEEQAKEYCNRASIKYLGPNPNCLKPLIVEVDD